MRDRPIILSLLFSFIAVSSALADDTRRDGNWWIQQTRPYKLIYIVGFFDGMPLGHNFSIWELTHVPKYQQCISLTVTSWTDYNTKYMTSVTNDQLADGLDEFFADYKNRRILVSDGAWLVLNEIAGTPKDQIEKLIEGWRRSAGQ